MKTVVDEMTERWLDEAGITSGMRVVDIGCGPGMVTVELARRVGDTGRVFAVDREPRMLALARDRCQQLNLTNVEFIHGTFELPMPSDGPVDAVVGRRVLMYQANPVAALTSLCRVVRPGGLVWFHEHDFMDVPHGDRSLPLHARVRGWLHAMLRNEGASLTMGHDLFRVMSEAGLMVSKVRAEANVWTPATQYPIAQLFRMVMPRITGPGIATEAEVDVDTLEQRLTHERSEASATLIWEMVFGAWGHVPT